MVKIGLIKEGKMPPDNRVALMPSQCRWIMKHNSDIEIMVQSSNNRCFTDAEYKRAGILVTPHIQDCDVLMGIKEVPVTELVAGKTYLFFSHTKKKQSHNRQLFQTIIQEKITLIDFECLTHADGQRIIGFGFFAGVVGAHNGIMAYGKRTGAFELERVYKHRNLKALIHSYFGLKLPNIKIAVTGSGRVAHGILEVMNLMGIIEVEKDEYTEREFDYPVYVHLKGADLYEHKETKTYNRTLFHQQPEAFNCIFEQYIPHTDILLNGVYWDAQVPQLFTKEAISEKDFRIRVIADVTDDANGSVPINSGDGTIENPVYGIDKTLNIKTIPYLPNSVDIMAVGNLPNELPRDASRYFGEQLIKYILTDLAAGGSPVIEGATMVKNGILSEPFQYLQEYAGVI